MVVVDPDDVGQQEAAIVPGRLGIAEAWESMVPSEEVHQIGGQNRRPGCRLSRHRAWFSGEAWKGGHEGDERDTPSWGGDQGGVEGNVAGERRPLGYSPQNRLQSLWSSRRS